MRYTIKGVKDILSEEKFWTNGMVCQKSWQNDSVYQYHQFGQLGTKSYAFKDSNTINGRRVMIYNLDGKLSEQQTQLGNKKEAVFFDAQERLRTMKVTNYASDGSYRTTDTYFNNHRAAASWSVRTNFGRGNSETTSDTTFYPNNRIRSIKITKKKDFEEENALFLPDIARYDYLAGLPESEDIGEAIDNAMKASNALI